MTGIALRQRRSQRIETRRQTVGIIVKYATELAGTLNARNQIVQPVVRLNVFCKTTRMLDRGGDRAALVAGQTRSVALRLAGHSLARTFLDRAAGTFLTRAEIRQESRGQAPDFL
jgi:hypothetical protein